ncbi:MAG: NAD(P)/FAD-dependent oxidoreductase [Acidobacteria bacterium]|nr:MAG: NAD(P)/FAD-dependent oxidoreductase [Acidobacteriota bacterium]
MAVRAGCDRVPLRAGRFHQRGERPGLTEPSTGQPDRWPVVVIVGAGFGGLSAAGALARGAVRVCLIDQRNFQTFQPLLYQVATAGLDPNDVCSSVRGMMFRQANLEFVMGRVDRVDTRSRQVVLDGGSTIEFDYLVIAAGAVSNDFGVEGVEGYALPLYTLDDALKIRTRILLNWERANRSPHLIGQGLLDVVIAGGGPTGVEVAGALAELYGLLRRRDYRNLDTSEVHLTLVEGGDDLLAPFHRASRRAALATLREKGVDVVLSDMITGYEPGRVQLRSGRVLAARTLVWAAGVKASPLAAACGAEQTRGGRIVVNDDLSVAGLPEVFAIGDVAAAVGASGELLPQVAQVAIQSGKHVAHQILRRSSGLPAEPFRYRDRGSMATIGRNQAVVELPFGLRISGRLAWLTWLVLHLLYLAGVRNRFHVLVNWSWSYLTYDRGARLIQDRDRDQLERRLTKHDL